MRPPRLIVATVASVAVLLGAWFSTGQAFAATPRTTPVVTIGGQAGSVARMADCAGACVIADAPFEWGCSLSGVVVGAGTTILFPEASWVWATLASSAWTSGCVAINTTYLSTNQVNGLADYEYNNNAADCFYVWPKSHSTWTIKCAEWFMGPRR